jgi:hypothetical protein
MLGSLLSVFLGSGVRQITDALGAAHARKIAAQTNEAKLEADKEIATLEAHRDVLIAEQGAGGMRTWVRPLFGFVVLIYFTDQLLLGGEFTPTVASVDPLIVQWAGIIVTAYFIGRTAEKITRTRR